MIDKLCCEFGVLVLLIEYDMSFVMGVFDCIFVMEYGWLIVIGMLEVVCNDLCVIKVYLGEE